ncbi:uncharacterized protein LOC143344536 [Colletes latitarsis]|uniref:uncharacterized protein LOC143344536 n=1 Tax=Colletes latitarsis TaxID=2605962 RepID=UPI0040358C19
MEDTQYRIFTTTNTLNCFMCKQEGHVAKLCPYNTISKQDKTTANVNSSPSVTFQTTESSTNRNTPAIETPEVPMELPEKQTTESTTDPPKTHTGIKRPLSHSSNDTNPDYKLSNQQQGKHLKPPKLGKPENKPSLGGMKSVKQPYEKVITHLTEICKESKKEAWKDYISSITAQTPTKRVWEKIKRINGDRVNHGIQFLETEPNKYVTHHDDIANLLAEQFKLNSSNNNYNLSFIADNPDQDEFLKEILLHTDDNNMNPTLNVPISSKEITSTLSTTKNSAPGPDNIQNKLLKSLPKPGIDHLLKIYNCIWTHKVFPANWRKAIVVPILKSNKNKHKPESYRPIALTNTMCKLLEKIINKRLRWHLEANSILTPIQYGFWQYRSRIDVLTNIEADICDAFQRSEHLVAICLDIEKAYDMIWKPKIIKTLSKININGHMLAFIVNFLIDRSIQVRTNGSISNPIKIQNGIPQGSVISVTLFLIGINDIVKNLNAPIKAYLYADNLTIICHGKNLNTIYNLLQTSINHLQEWSNKSGLKFSPQKTQCILFTKKTKYQTQLKLTMGETELKFVDHIRLLGLILDKKLTWVPHMRYLRDSCMKRLNIIKVLANNNWGADQEILLQTYRALIRAKIDYGSTVFNSAKKRTLKIIDPIHHTALSISTGLYYTCPITSILFEANEMTLEQRRKYLTLKYASKISATPDNPTFNRIYSDSFNKLYSKKPKLPQPLRIRLNKILKPPIEWTPTIERKQSKIAPWIIKTPPINLNLADLPKNQLDRTTHKTKFLNLKNSFSHCNQIYTDASKSDLGAGYSIVTENLTIKQSLPKATSIFTAKAYAIFETLKHASINNLKNVAIFSDSLSVIKDLETTNSNNSHEIITKIQETYTELDKNSNTDINIIWVPSHQGITGNEEADVAAKDATTLPPTEITVPIPCQDLINHIKKTTKEEWNRIWTTTKRTKIHDIIQNFYQPIPICNLNRKEKAIMSRLSRPHPIPVQKNRTTKTEIFYKTGHSPYSSEQHKRHHKIPQRNKHIQQNITLKYTSAAKDLAVDAA